MLQFKSIKIRNFKNIAEADLILDKVNILVGSNNSGKSNFLSLAATMRHLLKGGEEGRMKFSREVTRHFLDSKDGFSLELNYVTGTNVIYDCCYKIEVHPAPIVESERHKLRRRMDFQITSESLRYKSPSSRGPAKTFFKREGSHLEMNTSSNTSVKAELSNRVPVMELLTSLEWNLTKDEERILRGINNFCQTRLFCAHHGDRSDFQDAFKKLYKLKSEKSAKYQQFTGAFKKILNVDDFNVEEYMITKDTEEDAFYLASVMMPNAKSWVAFNQLSDGSKILFDLLFSIVFSTSELVFIDEPEIGLHPQALNELFKFLLSEKQGKQFLIATHSSYLVNLADPGILTLVETRDDGRSIFNPVKQIPNLRERLKSKYVHFGDLLAENFRTTTDTKLE